MIPRATLARDKHGTSSKDSGFHNIAIVVEVRTFVTMLIIECSTGKQQKKRYDKCKPTQVSNRINQLETNTKWTAKNKTKQNKTTCAHPKKKRNQKKRKASVHGEIIMHAVKRREKMGL